MGQGGVDRRSFKYLGEVHAPARLCNKRPIFGGLFFRKRESS